MILRSVPRRQEVLSDHATGFEARPDFYEASKSTELYSLLLRTLLDE